MGLEIPLGASTFREILERGNYIPQSVSFLPKGGNAQKDTATEGDEAGALGIDAPTYTYHFGKFNPENKTGYYGVHMGYNALSKNTGQSNTAIGAFAMENNVTGEYNTAYGYFAGNKLTSGSRNTFVGINAGKNVKVADNLTLIGANAGGENLNYGRITLKDVTDLCPAFGIYFNELKEDAKIKAFGWNASDQTITSNGIYVGSGCGDLQK